MALILRKSARYKEVSAIYSGLFMGWYFNVRLLGKCPGPKEAVRYGEMSDIGDVRYKEVLLYSIKLGPVNIPPVC